MPTLRLLLLAGAAAGGVACAASKSPSSPTTPTYTLSMHQDSMEVYGCKGTAAECMTCDLYCRYYVAQKAAFSATLSLKPGDTTATFQSVVGKVTNAGTGVQIVVQMSQYCDYYFLQATVNGASISGTWSEQLDCHGLTRVGAFSGTS